VAFSPDGKAVVSGGEDGMVRLWDLSGKDPQAKLPVRGHDDEIRQTALSPDGRTLATTSWDGTLRLWDLGGTQPKPRETFRAVSAFATAVSFMADGRKLVTGNSDASVRIWDVSTGTARLQKTLSHGKPDPEQDRDEIWGLAVSTDGKVAVTSGRFHGLRVWDLTAEGPVDPVTVKKPSRYHGALAFSPDGSVVASGSSAGGTLTLWSVADVKSPKVQHQVDAGKAPVHAVAFAPDGKTVVSGGHDDVVRFWDVSGGMLKERATLNHEKGSVQSVHYSPDGSKLVVAYGSGCVLVCDSSGKELHEWQLEGPASARFAPDGRHVVTENGNATVYVLRLPP
jgi:WD40 repeat protein